MGWESGGRGMSEPISKLQKSVSRTMSANIAQTPIRSLVNIRWVCNSSSLAVFGVPHPSSARGICCYCHDPLLLLLLFCNVWPCGRAVPCRVVHGVLRWAQVNEARDAFDVFDDKDGVLAFEDLGKVLEKLGFDEVREVLSGFRQGSDDTNPTS